MRKDLSTSVGLDHFRTLQKMAQDSIVSFQVGLEQKDLGEWVALRWAYTRDGQSVAERGGHEGCGKEQADVREMTEEEPPEPTDYVLEVIEDSDFSRLSNQSHQQSFSPNWELMKGN